LQPQRLSMPDPLMRIAFACNGFFEKALEDPSWAAVVARMAWSFPTVGRVARSRLLEDLKLALKEAPQQDSSLELNLEVVLGIVLQVLAAIGQRRLSSRDRQAAVGSILRAIGADSRRVRSMLARLPEIEPAESSAAQRKPNTRKAKA